MFRLMLDADWSSEGRRAMRASTVLILITVGMMAIGLISMMGRQEDAAPAAQPAFPVYGLEQEIRKKAVNNTVQDFKDADLRSAEFLKEEQRREDAERQKQEIQDLKKRVEDAESRASRAEALAISADHP